MSKEKNAEGVVMRVSGSSEVKKVAGAIAGFVRENGNVSIHAIGAGAINQSIKSIAVARGFLSPVFPKINCIPMFEEVVLENGEERTAIKFLIET